MDRFRRTKVTTTVINRTSDNNQWASPINHTGKFVIGKENSSVKSSSSEFSSCRTVVRREEEDLLAFEVGQGNSSRQLPGGGATMKKLLGSEMLKESESGRRSPSVIAKLMGLDGLPAQQSGNKQQERRNFDYDMRSNYGTGSGRSGKVCEREMSRKNGKGRKNVRDVYEVADRSNRESRSNALKEASYGVSSEDRVDFVRQKFMDVKRFSTDEKFQDSKEFHDALEVLDSNKDLLLQFLHEPDSLFSKHLHHMHGASDSHCGGALRMKSSNTLKSNIDVIGSHSGGEASQKIDISHSRKCQCNVNHVNHRRGDNLHKSNFSAEDKEDAAFVPTRIVVLKPNLVKARSTARSTSSTTSAGGLASNIELCKEYSDVPRLGPKMRGKRSKSGEFDIYGRKSRESRELAREITSQMRNKLGVDSFNVASSGCRGYSADESSRDMSENDVSYDSEVTVPSSQTSFNRIVKSKVSAFDRMESPVNREAKKRLSQRWKMNHRSQDFDASVKGSTLADMLAVPDVDIGQQNSDIGLAQGECSQRIRRDAEATDLISPLGISSRDGWKDGCIRNLSRSRSLPASPNHFGGLKSTRRHESIATKRFPIRDMDSGHERNKAFKRDSRRKVSVSESRRSRKKESQSTRVEMQDETPEVLLSENMRETCSNGVVSPDVKAVILEMPSCRHDTGFSPNTLVDKEYTDASKSQNVPDELVLTPGQNSDVSAVYDSSTCNVPCSEQESSKTYDVGGASLSQYATTQTEFPESSKESEQPSPVSVLEAPFVEEISSGSECFERVSAELSGLRKQLQLLKLESEDYDEGSILLSSDEGGEESNELDDGKGFYCIGESWESSYFIDVLTDWGLDKTDHDMFIGTWHSAQYPIDPWVFENMEKKYNGCGSCSRSERRLLFDRINVGIIQLFLQFVDMRPWVKPLLRNVGPQYWKEGFKSELLNLLRNHEKKATENALDAFILSEMQWLKVGDHISVVGSDIERLLIDELVAELLPLESGRIL